MRKHRGLFLALGLAATMGFVASEARAAATIDMTITLGNGDTIDVNNFATGGTTTSFGTVDLTTLNAKLTNDGSAYQFTGLGGGSNFAGATQGLLNLNGGIEIAAGATGDTSPLTITETESGFTSPSGTNGGTLLSSSSATFANQAAGAGQTASSMYNAIMAGPYNVYSSGLPVNSPGNSSSAAIAAFVTPYSMTNTLAIGLTASATANVTDQFGLSGTVTASAIPEPASIVMMLTSMPIPLAIVGFLRRRRRAAASA